MPRNPAGRWVARAGATGGSRTYRGQTPVNWYAVLVAIIILGILSVVFARYEYQHPASAATSTTPPTTKTTWYAAITFDFCGKVEPSLASNASSTSSAKAFYTTGDGVITVHPQTDSEAGKNAVLGKFISGYKGLTLTATQFGLPATPTSLKHPKTPTVYRNGDSCPKGTPDYRKTSEVQVTYWSSAFASKAKPTTVPGDPATLRFTDHQLISVGFVPPGTKLAKPSGTIVEALLNKVATSTSTTATTTTAPSAASTTTTAPSAASTTTTAPSTSTTAAKSGSTRKKPTKK